MALLGSQARVGRFACFYPPEAAARARSELELKIAAVEGRFESEGWRARTDCSRFWARLAARDRRTLIQFLLEEINHKSHHVG
jgi:hypothetical protein